MFRNLKNENYLKGLDEENFAERAGEYLAEINVLHPFRELRSGIRHVRRTCDFHENSPTFVRNDSTYP